MRNHIARMLLLSKELAFCNSSLLISQGKRMTTENLGSVLTTYVVDKNLCIQNG